ncbi:cardiotrophin-like cytokine factor 1 [Latimeria chalumnae]|uniref:cardiotrophin-like cytokine factor 1 n=1 Tax=Latimeria chalumnae TaxID=7897 RepID=UPI00313E71C6
MDFGSGISALVTFLLAALLNTLAVPAMNLTDPTAKVSIQKTYDLTKYLEHQLSTLASTYLNYLGPPFNDPDFSPPRVNGTTQIPSATVDFELWRGLNDRLRLVENYRAYSVLLRYLELMTQDLSCPELRRHFNHFCTSLQGLIVSIASVMTSLGYPPPAHPLRVRGVPGVSGGGAWALAGTASSAPSTFLKKMDDFWLLKELQIWLWRSAKDFNRLKKRSLVSTMRWTAQAC